MNDALMSRNDRSLWRGRRGFQAGIFLLPAFAALATGKPELNEYLYENTRVLVQYVEDAATLLEQQGTGAFPLFKQPPWLTGERYLFVYGTNGVCLFHGEQPELVDKNLFDYQDIEGHPVGQWMQDIPRQPEPDAAGWVFYQWRDGDSFYPNWKAAYVRKARFPDGTVCLVGSGLNQFHIEKVFVSERVDQAASLLAEDGLSALEQIKNPASPYVFLDNYIFVLDMDGQALVDPAFPDGVGRNWMGFRDAVGKDVIRIMLTQLRDKDTCWMQYLWPKPDSFMPSRKLMYMRKIVVEGRELAVGSGFYLATPIWMRL